MTQNDPQGGGAMAPQTDRLGVKNNVKKYACENDDFLMTFRVPKGSQKERFRMPKSVKRRINISLENQYWKNVVFDAKSTPK